jgi:hypothetical protein
MQSSKRRYSQMLEQPLLITWSPSTRPVRCEETKHFVLLCKDHFWGPHPNYLSVLLWGLTLLVAALGRGTVPPWGYLQRAPQLQEPEDLQQQPKEETTNHEQHCTFWWFQRHSDFQANRTFSWNNFTIVFTNNLAVWLLDSHPLSMFSVSILN